MADNIIWGLDFKAGRKPKDPDETDFGPYWETICGMPQGSFRGEYMGVPCFEVDRLPTDEGA